MQNHFNFGNVHKLQNLYTFLGFRREVVPLCKPALTPIIQRIIWGCYGKSMIYQANSHIYFTIVLQFILSQHSIKLLELLIGQIQFRLWGDALNKWFLELIKLQVIL